MATVQQFDFNVDLLRAVLWQYQDATGLQSVLQAKSAWYEENQRDFWTNWTRDVFDLTTANDFGCAVWGVILGLPLSIGQPGTGDRGVWGFGVENENYENAGFGRKSAGVSALTLEEKRIILRLRYFQIVSDGSVPFANFALQAVLGQGYVRDNYDMTVTYVFETRLPEQLATVLQQFDLLPRPAGVGTNILYLSEPVWGFGPEHENFENGPFGS
jgi:hypothetical protein